ncbi:Pyridine nucleotide-disulphide oxidoreductase [Micromonospora phaseoli]|uniref:Pyridine nucleotide-disulphide oxidoreductase n=1 Tax=Micromonospora phaseoli TaxID=1144548 RepID=A0A1H7DSL8_9ACTN|nr:FAD-dependent oxidoreductase [Micromonospora phaseoli]PZV99175.1 pyridine nucleotide-disulfide oxidoreductase [Micromonospora phaseoli]GIJ80028.1 flavoprotein [Micromonospora phaseoli]SEK04726.1 Pyridine nucleotide-disulphide oxidoreductase [Micromonospora phaseoli]
MSDLDQLPVAVIGAGPVGLAAAAHLHERGLPFTVLESGDTPGAAVRQWGHVRVFSPWRYNIDPAARRLLDDAGWVAPDPDALPTGAELAAGYLQPLADLPQLKPHLRYRARVEALSRLGYDRLRTAGREQAPFLIRLAGGQEILARAVIDASGTWHTPNVLGASGLPARGERDAAAHLEHALPDVLGADRDRFAGRHTLVVGAGHSAANTLLSLAELAITEPGTEVTWAIRSGSPARAYGGGDADALPARGALGSRLRAHVDAGRIRLLTGFSVHAIDPTDDRVTVIVRPTDGIEEKVVVDRIVAATGYRPDHAIAAELRLDLDPIMGATRALAPLIDPNEHSCGTVPPHGVKELAHPEPGYYAVGMKSYGRAPTFLMATGYEQVRSVVAALAGDWQAAHDVQLDLPETGVCNSNPDDSATGDGCCGPAPEPVARGLATGISGGLLGAPLNLVGVGTPSTSQTGGCCGN